MSKSFLIAILVALALIGLIDSWYLAQHAVTETALFCDIGAGLDGCNVVAQSPYSQLFDMPLAYYGLAFYALLLVAVVLIAFFPYRMYYRVLVALAGIGVAASAVFVYIQLVLIKAICIYCFVSAGVAVLALIVAALLYTRFAPAVPAVVSS